jgi:hypothetical protein
MSIREAVQQSLRQLEREWESETCAVCGSSKWPNFPFCRLCTLRLRRYSIQRIMGIWAGNTLQQIRRRGPFVASAWAQRYDICRDFLWTVRRRS